MSEYRNKQRALTGKADSKANCKTNSKANVSSAEEERDKERDKDKEKKESKKIDYQQIADMYNSLCPSFPSLKSLSESRKKAIKARLNTYSVSDFEELFKKAEASDFLKGNNGRNWTATFDWLIKDGNMAKVLEGNYDNRQKKTYGPNGVEVETPAEDDFAGIF
jgi:hypothetical protein